MKNGNGFDRFEKTIILIGVLVALLLACLGVLKSTFTKEDPYVSQATQSQSDTNKTEKAPEKEEATEVSLKQETFEVKRNGNLGTDASDYFDGSASELKKVELDLSAVDLSAEGTYEAKASYDDKEYSFQIKIIESYNPYVTAYNTSFKYMVGAYSSIDEVISMAGVQAVDIDGDDISDSITGWPTELPSENGTYSYHLSVTDDYGNTGYIVITITFQKV